MSELKPMSKEDIEAINAHEPAEITVLRETGWLFDRGDWHKSIDQKDVRIDFKKIARQGAAVTVDGRAYTFGLDSGVDQEVSMLFTSIAKKKAGGVVPLKKRDLKPEPPRQEPKEHAAPKQETGLIVTSGNNNIVRPAVSAAEAIVAWQEFEDLKTAIIKPSDMQNISGKNFVKKSGWRKLAAFFNLSDNITEEIQTPHKEGGGWSWKIKVEVRAPNGRISQGVGICSTSERKFSHVEHDTYATAHTRAKNRAISDMIAGGEITAEEMEP